MAFKMTSPLHVEDPKSDANKIAQGLTTMQARAPQIKKAREETLKKKKPTPKTKTPRKKVEPMANKAKGVGVQTGDYGKGTKNKKGVAKGLDVKAPKISTKKPTVKPKDNSRKAIRKRKTADKAAGVSKSQMRANKAKSKSEAFMAKAKASKDPSMRAQLKRKSDRLAKRAARKGNS